MDVRVPAVEPPQAQVAIVGGGFAGIQVAEGLAGTAVGVTIVDQHNFHTFLPLLYQVATAGLEPADIAYPIRTIFGKSDNVTFRHGRVTPRRLVRPRAGLRRRLPPRLRAIGPRHRSVGGVLRRGGCRSPRTAAVHVG